MADENSEDLSMEDILSSIRNILTEDAAQQEKPSETADVADNAPAVAASPLPEIEIPVDAGISAAPETEEPLNLDNLNLPDPEDEVFNLSPSMIVEENDPFEAAPEKTEEAPVEVTEDDILDLSRLVADPDPLSAADSMPAPVIEPDPVYVGEPAEEASPFAAEEMDFSAMFNSEEPLNLGETEIDLDDVADSEPAFATVELQEEARPEDLSAAIPPLDFDLPKVDVDADPIFAPEEKVVAELDPQQLKDSIPVSSDEAVAEEEESLIDDATLDEILNLHSQAEDTHPDDNVIPAPAVAPEAAPVVEPVFEPSVPPAPVMDVQPESQVAEPVTVEQAPAEVPAPVEEAAPAADATDVSANIINNFAKLFAEKKAAEAVVETPVEEIHIPVKTDSASVGELVREAVVRQVTEQMTANFETFAREAVASQTQAWLDANLPAIVEAVVAKEIERVMAKVGS